jgi:hypothetical protein
MVIAYHRVQARHGDACAGRDARLFTSSARGYPSSPRRRHHYVGAHESVPYSTHYVTSASNIIIQNPTDQAEASIPTTTTVTNNARNWKRTVKERRKAVKRTLPLDLAGELLDLMTPPQDGDIPARKKPRLEEPLPTTTDEAARNIASPDVSEGLCPPTPENDDANANADADPVTDPQPNAGVAGGWWTSKEDAKLTRVVANTSKKKWGKEYKTDWPAISELIPGRTKKQCWQRWHDVLDPNIGRANGRKGKWTAVEDRKLKAAVQTHGDKDWDTISALVPGRMRRQCWQRWYDVLNPSIALTAGRTGTWEEDEDIKLKDAVQTQGDKDWAAISALVPGRTKRQCLSRWHGTLDPSIGRASARKGKWSAVEDSKLKHAIQTQGDKGWVAISALVPGRTKKQCWNRWKYMGLYHSTLRVTEHRTLKKAPGLGRDPHSP